MKKIIFTMALTALIIGCSSTSSKHGGKDGDAEIGFNMPNGSLILVVDGDGEFVSIKSSASAQVLSDTPAGKEAAVTVAKARAKRNIAEFMSDQIKSSDVISLIANATQNENTYAQHVAEKIITNSQALLRGAYVSKQSIEDDALLVEISITQVSVTGSKSLRNQIRGN